MTEWLLAFSLFAVVWYLAFAKFSLVFVYNGKSRIYLRYACFFLLLYPREKKNKDGDQRENAEIGKDIVLQPIKPPIQSERAMHKLPKFTVTIRTLTIYVGGKDPDKTVYLTTAVSQLVAALICAIDEFFGKVKVNDCLIVPAFTQENIQLKAKIEVSFRFYQFLRLLFDVIRQHTFRPKKALI